MSDTPLETSENAIADSSKRPAVITNFSGYAPPFDPVPIVERMVAFVPRKYLIGLSQIVLTNSSGLSRKLRRSVTRARKHKVKIVEAGGLYHQAWHGNQAWIEIFVDNKLRQWGMGWLIRFSYVREMLLGDVLFHEIGHHIHYTVRPEYREKEDVADDWMKKLQRNYFRLHHPLLRRLIRLILPLLQFFVKMIHVLLLWRGEITRTEYEKLMKQNSLAGK